MRFARDQDTAYHVFELSDELLGSASLGGCFTALNPAWERTLGFSADALMASPFIEFVHSSDRDATLAELDRLAAPEYETVQFQNRYAKLDGGWCWLSWHVITRNGHLFFAARDVTAHVAAEQRRHLLDHLVEGIDDAILTKTTDGIVTSWNQAAEWLYGFTATEAVGRSMLDLIVPDERRAEPQMIVARLLGGEGVRQYTTQRRHKDGTLLDVSLTASLLRDDSYRILGVAVVSRDTSELGADNAGVHNEIDPLLWVGRVREAIDEDRVIFHAQPIISLHDEPPSYELLCRMRDRDGETIPAIRFLPAAENYGLIEELDLLGVSEAARHIADGRQVNVNFSTATIGRRHIVDLIAEKLSTAGADPSQLTIEITETALMKDIAAAQRFASAVTDLGCHLALDDFGTGFGGFLYLKKLRIDQLKIDVEFIRDLCSSRASQHVVKAVLCLASSFGLDTVAEGVEDEPTLALLRGYGVTHAQGYLVAKPAPMADLVDHWRP